MKTLFISSLLLALLYPGCMAYQQNAILSKAEEALAQGRPEIALLHLAQIEKEPFQIVSAAHLETVCQQAWVQQARKLTDSSRFEEVMALTSQSAPCKSIAPELVEAVRAEIARNHMTLANKACRQGDYNQALGEFEHMKGLPYPESVQKQAVTDSAWCRLGFSHSLADAGVYGAALQQAVRAAADSKDAGVHHAATARVWSLAEQQTEALLQRRDWVHAMRSLAQLAETFKDEGALQSQLRALQLHLLMRAFEWDRELSSPDLVRISFSEGGNWKNSGFRLVNRLKFSIDLALRGLNGDFVASPVRAKKSKMVSLASGEYLLAIRSSDGTLVNWDIVTLDPLMTQEYSLLKVKDFKLDLSEKKVW
ncbi:MAG: hypothetical protein ACRERU_06350 [Methylococcales bacterium]